MVKSSSTPYKEARAGTYKDLRKELTRLEEVPAVARSSHPKMPQRPPIEEKNFHQQGEIYDLLSVVYNKIFTIQPKKRLLGKRHKIGSEFPNQLTAWTELICLRDFRSTKITTESRNW